MNGKFISEITPAGRLHSAAPLKPVDFNPKPPMQHRVDARHRRSAFSPAIVRVGLWSGLFALVVSLIAPASLWAQTAGGTGTVQGRVLNVGNNRYLNNARVTLEGTNVETFTNEFGEFRIEGVPAGEARVRAAFTGLDPEVVTVSVAPGQSVRADFSLSSRERYGEEKPLQLDTFVVQSNREYEGNALATNEQRYAPEREGRHGRGCVRRHQ
jgi:hypothetical protein